jgi:hypothetical protein
MHNFAYQGSEVNCKNDMLAEIKKNCILFANRCFHGLRKHSKSHLILRKTMMTLYKILARPIPTYASKT